METRLHQLQLELLARRQVPEKSRQELSDFRGTGVLQRHHDVHEGMVAGYDMLVVSGGAAKGEVFQRSQDSDKDLGVLVTNQAGQDRNCTMLAEGGEGRRRGGGGEGGEGGEGEGGEEGRTVKSTPPSAGLPLPLAP